MSIFAPASTEVSMCYGTLPRGGIRPSVVFLIEMSFLEKQTLAAFLIQPDFLDCCTHIDSCNYCLSDEPVGCAPLVLLIIIREDCFIPCETILLTFSFFQGFSKPSYS